jgi:hypothetical protein
MMAVIGAAVAQAQDKLTYVDLIKRLTDLEYLATLPAPEETCAQWSSYDRASRYDEGSGKYAAWGANGDGNGFIREEDGKIVMAEMQGPGCIRRIWSAAPGGGHVRIYLDGAGEPAVDLPFSGYFDGKNEPFTRKALCYVASKGWDCFIPIPYQKSCKVVADKNWGNYFHFTYTTFPKSTQVPTFKRELAPEESAALDEADRFLSHVGSEPAAKNSGEITVEGRGIELKAGGKSRLEPIQGPRAIVAIRAKLHLPESPKDRSILRGITLKIAWDNETEPSVWAPLGDFFGTAPGANPYTSLPSGLTHDGLWYSHWYMPFARNAVVELDNDGESDVALTFDVVHAPLAKPIESLGRFHVKWHRDMFPPPEPERAIDWTLLTTQGRGRYCGVMLHVWNPRGGWWGEGDEKFFVDGEKFPSTFGTGSEDYFGYAWSNPELFTRPYHNQTISENNAGHVSVNRWHIVDNVPFQKSFAGYIEKYFPNKKPTLYDCTVYWYLDPAGKDLYGPAPMAERLDWPQPEIKRVNGATEGEKITIIRKTGGKAEEQAMDAYGGAWSGGAQLWWTGAKPGDKLVLGIGIKQEGQYKLSAQLTKARDYGIVQLYLDDKKLGDPVDLYNPDVIPTGEIDLGKHKLDVRVHKLTVEITGANPKAEPAYMAGIDYVKLDPVTK